VKRLIEQYENRKHTLNRRKRREPHKPRSRQAVLASLEQKRLSLCHTYKKLPSTQKIRPKSFPRSRLARLPVFNPQRQANSAERRFADKEIFVKGVKTNLASAQNSFTASHQGF